MTLKLPLKLKATIGKSILDEKGNIIAEEWEYIWEEN